MHYDPIEPTVRSLLPLIVAIIAALTTLVRRIPDATKDHRLVGDLCDKGVKVERNWWIIVNADLRREWLRVGKHVVIIACITISFLPIEFTPEWRNIGFASIAAIMLTNSLLDDRAKRRARDQRQP